MKKYQLVIQKLNDSTEIINFESYTLAMNKYRQIKNDVENDSLKDIHMISFNQIDDSGKVKALFSKKVCEKQNLKTCRDIANDINSSISLLEAIKKHHEATIMITERKRELLLHLISVAGQKIFSNEKDEVDVKLNLFNELAFYENKRRESKMELDDIDSMQESLQNLNIDNLLKPKEKPRALSRGLSNTRQKYERIVKYKNEEEKDKIIRQNKSFAYYIIDEHTSMIYFYNRFDGNRALNEFRKSLRKSNVVKIAEKEIKNSEKVCKNKSDITIDEGIKVLEYNTIKQRSHYKKQYHKTKYEYCKWDDSTKKIYFSNSPIDLKNINISI